VEPDKAAVTWSTLAVNKRRAVVVIFDPPSAQPAPTAPKPVNNQGYPERLQKLWFQLSSKK
jgi:hypothetical protein